MTPSLTGQAAVIRQAISVQESLRATLGDAIVDTTIAALQKQLAELEAQAVPARDAGAGRQRKQATVLLADVSGFTAMAEDMDAEDVSDVMNALWERVDAVIVEHGGLIDKHIGDAVMALWGVEQAREDDPERAIRAALAVQSEIATWNRDRGSVSPISIRIGINTGPVLLGDVGTIGEFSAIGDTVNLTSRLQQAAPVGGILISHDTYRHVRGVFDVTVQEPLQVHGRTEAVRTYVVHRAKPRAFRLPTRGVEGIETRMVGRDAELRALQDAFSEAMETARTRVITIVGDAGVGKSRLLYEFDNWIELLHELVYYFKGRASPETMSIPYGLIRDMFAYRFGIRESDSAATVLEKFRAGTAGVLTPDQADLVGYLIGFEFREAGSRAVQNLLGDPSFGRVATAYLVDYVRAMASEPTVMFLEDIHWADDRSLDLLTHLVEEVPNARLLIVCLARPLFFERRPHWAPGQAAHTQLRLQPLSVDSSRALVDEILQRVDQVPETLRNLIVEGAEGNPFYVEELIKMLIEDSVIVRGEERWRVELGRLNQVRVPPTLTGVLQARLDSLPRPERAVLQRASVVGRLFWNAAVSELVADEGDVARRDQVDALLGAIRDRELVFRRDHSAFEGTDEYLFKHAILRDVTYETVLLRLRRVYHAQVARWLEATAGARLGEYLGLIARHYELAGETAQAVSYLRRAGQGAFAVSAYRDAQAAYERALALLPAAFDPQDRPAEGTAEALRAALLVDLGQVHSTLGGHATAAQFLAEGLALARQRGDKLNAARALGFLNNVAFRQGDAESADRYGLESLALYQELDNRGGVAFALKGLGMSASLRCDLEAAARYYEESQAIYQEIGIRWGEAACLINRGELARLQERYEEAIQYYKAALVIGQEINNRGGISFCYNNLGHVLAILGQDEAARSYLLQALRECLTLGNLFVAVETVIGIALLQTRAGHHESAAELLGLAMAHPARSAEARPYVEQVLAALRQALPADVLEAALARGREQDLETVMAGLVAPAA